MHHLLSIIYLYFVELITVHSVHSNTLRKVCLGILT